jgi:hypothetical protein
MRYLDFNRLDALDAHAFQHQKPYPWVNPESLLSDEGFHALLEALPDLSLFDRNFNVQRKFGQTSHDRFNLEYRDGLLLPDAWQGFINELRGDRYRDFITRLFGRGRFRLRFHWHLAPSGASVSPHCDSKRKLGSHIFYLHTSDDWEEAWGGATLVLDDNGRFSSRSNPAFEDFDSSITASCLDNRSFIFNRKGNSWHGVEEIRCPEDQMRKVFIVVIDDWGPVQRLLSGKRRKSRPRIRPPNPVMRGAGTRRMRSTRSSMNPRLAVKDTATTPATSPRTT